MVALLVAGLSATADAQLVNREDPCFIVLFEGEPRVAVFLEGTWNDRDDVALAAQVIRERSSWLLGVVTEARAQGSTAVFTPAVLERIRAFNRCLPWLRRLLSTLEENLKRLGISTVVVGSGRQLAATDALVRDIRNELETTERLLGDLLRR